jgi:hypothetical protein
MKNHTHNYNPHKRVGKLVIMQCYCGATETKIITRYTKERGAEMDMLISSFKKKNDG